ncbi:MAG: hypothetical protein PHF31_16620 [Methylobacter sp.]|nr:hypothetical protein [Methylobacter sp.]
MPDISKLKYRNGLGLPSIVTSSNAVMLGNDKAAARLTRLCRISFGQETFVMVGTIITKGNQKNQLMLVKQQIQQKKRSIAGKLA